jgi:hypothetical protein
MVPSTVIETDDQNFISDDQQVSLSNNQTIIGRIFEKKKFF